MPGGPDQVDRYAVVGNPIAHSLSPLIHSHFAEQTAQAMSYEAIEIARDAFVPRVTDLAAEGFRGLNVTVPFKQEAWSLCTQRSERAERAGAVNTIRFLADATPAGDNTDGVGLVRDLLHNLQLGIDGCRLLLLGAGGAVRGVLGPILAEMPRQLVLCNRTREKADALARDFSADGNLAVADFDELDGESFDLIINGTAAGLDAAVPPLPASAIGAGTVCYDMMYNREAPTAFVDWARRHGARAAHDGLGMLIEQAAEAFSLWREVRPETSAVIRLLRSS